MIPLQRFDFGVLDDPEFKEDAVREEIVAPLVRALGYEVSGPNRVVRGRRLEHPFVALGVSTHKVSIVPDYLLFVEDHPTWVLDAKAPGESKDLPEAYDEVEFDAALEALYEHAWDGKSKYEGGSVTRPSDTACASNSSRGSRRRLDPGCAYRS